jgi:hypothetical protein
LDVHHSGFVLWRIGRPARRSLAKEGSALDVCFLLVKFLLLALLLAPVLAFADGLTDVRATLQKLQSDQPLRARVEIKTRHSGGESNKQKQSEGVSTVIIESGADGLKLSWSPDQIRQSRKAAWAEIANPDSPKSDLAMLRALEAGQALNLLDAADPLRRGLERAVLLEDKPDTYKRKRARLLVLKIDLGLGEEERKALKSSEAIEKLWLDADGIPIAMDRNVEARFSKFLIGYKLHEHETREFQRAAGRLVATNITKENSGTGLGHSDESYTTITVTLLSD